MKIAEMRNEEDEEDVEEKNWKKFNALNGTIYNIMLYMS